MFYSLLIFLIKVFVPRRLRLSGTEYLEKLVPPYIIVANHVDYLDGLYITWAIQRVVNKKIYFLAETNNWWWTGSIIPINVDNRAASLEVAKARIASGHLVSIFPEGRRSNSNELLPGRTGAARLALASRVPIVPLGIIEKGGRGFSESVRYFFSAEHPITINIGPPIKITPWLNRPAGKETVVALTTEIMRAIGGLCQKTYQPLSNQ